jgi:hypothetical protein
MCVNVNNTLRTFLFGCARRPGIRRRVPSRIKYSPSSVVQITRRRRYFGALGPVHAGRTQEAAANANAAFASCQQARARQLGGRLVRPARGPSRGSGRERRSGAPLERGVAVHIVHIASKHVSSATVQPG